MGALLGPCFDDRTDAGRRLAERLAGRGFERPIVYALPRGGVPVAIEVARALKAPLDLVLVRKLGVPFQPELAFGAVVDGADPEAVLNEDVVRSARLTEEQIETIKTEEVAEIERRRALYFKGRERPDPAGRDVLVVDDGIATGATAKAAIHALKRQGAARVILAVPVAPPETLREMESEANEVVCLEAPDFFRGVGAWYRDFRQLHDAEVTRLLDQAAQPADGAG